VTFLGIKTHSDPSYIFSGGQDPPNSHDLRPWLHRNSPTTFQSLCLSPPSLSPVTHATHTKQLDHIVSSLVVVKRTLIYLQRNRSHLLVFQWQSRDVELTSAWNYNSSGGDSVRSMCWQQFFTQSTAAQIPAGQRSSSRIICGLHRSWCRPIARACKTAVHAKAQAARPDGCQNLKFYFPGFYPSRRHSTYSSNCRTEKRQTTDKQIKQYPVSNDVLF